MIKLFRRLPLLSALFLGGAAMLPLATAAAETPDRYKLAVMDILTPKDFDPALTASIQAAVTQVLGDMRAFDVASKQEAETIIDQERLIALLKSEVADVAYFGELGERLDADLIVAGGVVYGEEGGEAFLNLIQTSPPRTLAREVREIDGPPEAIPGILRTLTQLLVRDLLAKRSGWVRVVASEESATVYANGRIQGSTPLQKPIKLAEGLNTIEVERKGFIRARHDVEVVRDSETRLEITLVPSEEFIEEYKAAVSRQNLAGWTMIAVGVVLGGGAVAANQLAADRSTELNQDIQEFNRQTIRPESEFADLQDRESEIATFDLLTVIGAISSVAFISTGTGLLLANDDPRRYDGYIGLPSAEPRAAAPKSIGWPKLGLAGTNMRLSWRF